MRSSLVTVSCSFVSLREMRLNTIETPRRAQSMSRGGDLQCKLILLGNGSVGKTSIIGRFTDDGFRKVYKQVRSRAAARPVTRAATHRTPCCPYRPLAHAAPDHRPRFLRETRGRSRRPAHQPAGARWLAGSLARTRSGFLALTPAPSSRTAAAAAASPSPRRRHRRHRRPRCGTSGARASRARCWASTCTGRRWCSCATT